MHIPASQVFVGERTLLRILTPEDCSDRYVSWLRDPAVNRFLETRWAEQTLETVAEFVAGTIANPRTWLFAILDRTDEQHVGNIKVGPIDPRHSFGDVSYLIGERDRWGRGLATDAIRVATKIGFEVLDLHRLQAGVYESNRGSMRALEKCGYRPEGVFRKQLRSGDRWEDHYWYGILREDWIGSD